MNWLRFFTSNGFCLLGFLALCLIVSGIGGAITATSVDTWYQTLQKPTFNPPDWVFAPVWNTLYILMAIAGWRVWIQGRSTIRRRALIIFAIQLGFNLAWSFLFFGLQRIDWALANVLVLLLFIIINNNQFWRVDRLAGVLFGPYVLWVVYATFLNASLWLLN